MKIKTQFFQEKFKVPENLSERKTSELLCDGVFTFYRNPGIPYYSPIGKKIIHNLQKILLEESEKLDFDHVDVPLIIRDELLEMGQDMRETFRDKVLYLNGRMKGYHLFTTPEMMMLDLAGVSLISHNQLPIRQVYDVEVFRGIKDSSKILKGRQFKTFMGTSFDSDEKSLGKSLELFSTLSKNIFERLGIKTFKRKNVGGIDTEFFYFCDEGESLNFPEISQERIKALSLAMSYQYHPNKGQGTRYRNRFNKNSPLLIGTYGLGTQRVFYAILNSSRDEKGFALPESIKPFEWGIFPFNKDSEKNAETLYGCLKNEGKQVLLDTRANVTWGKKAKFMDYLGLTKKVVVKSKKYIVKERGGHELMRTESIADILELRPKILS